MFPALGPGNEGMSQPYLLNVELHLPHLLVRDREKDSLQVRHLHRVQEKQSINYFPPLILLLSSLLPLTPPHPVIPLPSLTLPSSLLPSSKFFPPLFPPLALFPPSLPSLPFLPSSFPSSSSHLFLCHGHGYGLPVHQITQWKNIMVCYHNRDTSKPDGIHETRAPCLVATGTKTKLGCLESPEKITIFVCHALFCVSYE